MFSREGHFMNNPGLFQARWNLRGWLYAISCLWRCRPFGYGLRVRGCARFSTSGAFTHPTRCWRITPYGYTFGQLQVCPFDAVVGAAFYPHVLRQIHRPGECCALVREQARSHKDCAVPVGAGWLRAAIRRRLPHRQHRKNCLTRRCCFHET
jgi:hypothetical protein